MSIGAKLTNITPRIVGHHNLDFEIMNRSMADYKTHNLDYTICGAFLVNIISILDYGRDYARLCYPRRALVIISQNRGVNSGVIFYPFA
jgi:hypothetical protein